MFDACHECLSSKFTAAHVIHGRTCMARAIFPRSRCLLDPRHSRGVLRSRQHLLAEATFPDHPPALGSGFLPVHGDTVFVGAHRLWSGSFDLGVHQTQSGCCSPLPTDLPPALCAIWSLETRCLYDKCRLPPWTPLGGLSARRPHL